MTRESANDVVIDGLTEIVLQKGDEMYNKHVMRWTMSMMWCDVQWAWCDEMYNEHDLMRWAWLDRMGMMWQDEHDVTRWAWCVEMSMIWRDEQITRCVEMNNEHNVTRYTIARCDEMSMIGFDVMKLFARESAKQMVINGLTEIVLLEGEDHEWWDEQLIMISCVQKQKWRPLQSQNDN